MYYYWKIRKNKKLEKWSRAENNKVEQCLDVDYWLSYNYFFPFSIEEWYWYFWGKEGKETNV